jgi:LemA protein
VEVIVLSISLLAAVAALVAIVGWVVAIYNRLVRLRTQAQASWAQVEVQLKRRHSLIPNLVTVVKGYTTHERTTLEAVVQARESALAMAAQGVPKHADAEGTLSQALGRLLALAESYPDLKANDNFAALQRELASTEDKIAYARQFYNSSVQSLNGAVQSTPTNLIARRCGFHAEPYYQAGEGARESVGVQF